MERRRGWQSERRRDVVPSQSIWISPVPIRNVNAMGKKGSVTWFPTELTELEVPGRLDSICAEPAGRLFRAEQGRLSSISEVPRRKSDGKSVV